MKRINNVFDKIISVENLLLANKNAMKGKLKQKGVINFNRNLTKNVLLLQEDLIKGYKNPPYKVFIIKDPKEREIFVLPYRDRVVHHAILQIIGDMFYKCFTNDTYSSIKERGVHLCKEKIEKVLRTTKVKYALKLDITKFYPSIDNEILKQLVLRKIKDKRLLSLLFEIIDSSTGMPIGNSLSQTLSNFYVTYFDHWLKEDKKVENVWRYCDDILIVHDSKEYLHSLFEEIKAYLQLNLKLTVNNKYQVFPIAIRGIDFLGYRMFGDYTLLRKRTKKKMFRKISKGISPQSLASYKGIMSHCNSTNLNKKVNEKIKTNLF